VTFGESEWLKRDPVQGQDKISDLGDGVGWKMENDESAKRRTETEGECHSSVSPFESVVIEYGVSSVRFVFFG
jgi:hypothetical protein